MYDRQPIAENQLKRPMGHHAGRVYPFTALIRARESEGRKYIVQRGGIETRVVDIGADAKSVGLSHVLPAKDVLDIQPARGTYRQEVTVDSRGNLVIPADLRNRFKLTGRSVVEVVEQADGFLVRPVRPDDACP